MQLRDPHKPKTQTKIRTTYRYMETCCEICQSGSKSSLEIKKTKECWHRGTHPQTLLRIRTRNVLQKEHQARTVSSLTSRKTEIAKSASEPRLQMAPCRKRAGDALPRAEKFADLITADHMVLQEGDESRNNHRYAVVVQYFATQWIQAYPCKTKTSQEMERNVPKFLEPSEKPQVFFSDNCGRVILEPLHIFVSPF